jgi:ribonuclease HI
MYTLQFDGLFMPVRAGATSSSQAGFMCYGWLISKNGHVIARGHGGCARSQDATSNVAEYLALIEGLDALHDMGIAAEPVAVMGDAKSIINQMEGTSNVVSNRIKPLYRRARRLSAFFRNLRWAWTPRRYNRQADELTRRAMRQIRRDPDSYQAALKCLGKPVSGKAFNLIDLRIYHSPL